MSRLDTYGRELWPNRSLKLTGMMSSEFPPALAFVKSNSEHNN